MDFEALKSSSSGFDKLTKALETNLNPEDQSNKNKYQDDRLWKPELDKTGNGYAVFRFLPAVKDEDFFHNSISQLRCYIKVVGILRTH